MTTPSPDPSGHRIDGRVPLFDSYVFVDWSARNSPTPVKPAKDAIWVGQLTRGGSANEWYCTTRTKATSLVRDLLVDQTGSGKRVLVGFDFPYGYPTGLGQLLATDGVRAWRAVWDFLGSAIADDAANKSNRFMAASQLNATIGGGPGPFWGCPQSRMDPQLTSTKNGLFTFPFQHDRGALARLRLTEKAIKGVQESWKLMGAGSVGSQALVGIPRVLELCDDQALKEFSQVWPFETGFTSHPSPDHGPWILHAEIWPGVLDGAEVALEKSATNAIHDQAQVRLMCRWAAAKDDAGTLGRWFDSSVLTPADRAVAAEHEGWILGVPA